MNLITFYFLVACVGFRVISTKAIATDSDESADMDDNRKAINSELVDRMSWKCANNASCLYSIANSVLSSYTRGETVQFGLFNLVKLPPAKKNSFSRSKYAESGRAAGLLDFLSGNALRIPVGPMVFSVQRANDDNNYIEVALLKKGSSQGRRQGEERYGGGGGLGGGGGIGGGGIHRHKDKKQFQMLIPMYLAATTLGWTMLAVKAVGILTLKALAISKLAFLVTALIIVKKLMDHASQKTPFESYPEHQPFIMPYNMDYGIHPMAGGAEIATGDMYPAAVHIAAPHSLGHTGMENLAAESNLHAHAIDVQNTTQVMAALNAAGLGQKIKRDDTWIGKDERPVIYNYIPQHRPLYTYRH